MDFRIIAIIVGGLIAMTAIMSNAPVALYVLYACAAFFGAAAFISRSPIGEAIAEQIRNYKPEISEKPSKKKHIKIGKASGEYLEEILDDVLGELFPNRNKKFSRNEREKIASDFPEGLIAIMFTDMENFTRYIERGDAEAFALLKKHNKIITESADHWDGHVVKGYGDGFMLAFPSARKAVYSAVSIQRLIESHNIEAPESELIQVRIGIDAGEPIKEGDDYIGRTVNLAARIAASAHGGQTYVSQAVRHLVGPIQNLEYIDKGPHELKGFSEKQHLYAISRVAALAHPLDSDIDKNLAELEEKVKRGE